MSTKLCKKCEKEPTARGVKLITCKCCGESEGTNVEYLELCEECLDKKNICAKCGSSLGKEDENVYDIKLLDPNGNEVIVIQCKEELPFDEAAALYEYVAESFSENKVVLIPSAYTLKLMEPDRVTELLERTKRYILDEADDI